MYVVNIMRMLQKYTFTIIVVCFQNFRYIIFNISSSLFPENSLDVVDDVMKGADSENEADDLTENEGANTPLLNRRKRVKRFFCIISSIFPLCLIWIESS